MKNLLVLPLLLFFTFSTTQAQKKAEKKSEMKTYVIERTIPGAGDITTAELKDISKKSCDVLKEMDSPISWMHSYVTDDKVYCVYQSKSKDLILEHAKICGFPADSVSEVANIIGPETAK